MEHAHGGGPPRARVAAQAAGGPPHPDLSPERITPWEAMRIHVYRDQEVAWRVLQRLERYNAVPSDLTGHTQRQYVLDNPFLSQRASRGVPGQRQPQPRDARAAQAAPGRPGRQPRPQGGAARLGRLRLRHGARRVQAGPGSRPALQRRPLLPRRARARGHAGGDDGAVRGGARGARPGDRRLRGRVLRRHHALGRAGLGGRSDARRRERRLHDQEHQRPRRRHWPHRGRVGGLLPARLQAHEHRSATAASARSRSSSSAKGASVRARKGYYAGLDTSSRERERGERHGLPARPRLALPERCRPAAHERPRLPRGRARQGERPRGLRGGRVGLRLRGAARGSWRTTCSTCWSSRTATPASTSATTRTWSSGSPPPRATAWHAADTSSRARSSSPPAATRRRSSCATRTAAASAASPTSSTCRSSTRCAPRRRS